MDAQARGLDADIAILFRKAMFFFYKLFLEDFIDFMGDLLAAGERKNVLTEDLQALIEHVQGQRVQKRHLRVAILDKLLEISILSKFAFFRLDKLKATVFDLAKLLLATVGLGGGATLALG
mmetsp:Transcript_32214/g.42669  ORF Transcript_32214/g.42669 Transcript_32214/m.42669 type:complete len:121 (+) Transcript_32214:893-1255(+)